MGAGRREAEEQRKQLKGENSSANSLRHSLSPVAMLKVPALISESLSCHHIHFKISKNRHSDKLEGTPN